MNDVRVFIVASDLLVRTGLSALLERQSGVRLVGQSDGRNILDEVDIFQPDVMLWDLGWQVSDFATLTQLAELPTLFLVADKAIATQVWGAMRPEAVFGLLPRDSQPDVLLLTLNALQRGLVVVAPSFVDGTGQAVVVDTFIEPLTTREDEVLQLLAQGMTNKAIAHRLKITDHTVKFHVNAIMTKLNAQSRTDAVVKATRNGLVVL